MTDQASEPELSRAGTLSAARRRAVLEDRAARLARRLTTQPLAPADERLLVCGVGENLYGLPLRQVARVRPFTGCGAAVSDHPAVLGLVSDDGQIRPAVDLSALLGAEAPRREGGWLIILAPPWRAALRVSDIPFAAAAEAMPDRGQDRMRVLGSDHHDKVLVRLAAGELLERLSQSQGAHGA